MSDALSEHEIHRLRTALRAFTTSIHTELGLLGCIGNFDTLCHKTRYPQSMWCEPCRMSIALLEAERALAQ